MFRKASLPRVEAGCKRPLHRESSKNCRDGFGLPVQRELTSRRKRSSQSGTKRRQFHPCDDVLVLLQMPGAALPAQLSSH